MWRVPVSALRVIGEFTNTDGPYADDYFLVFITHDQTFEVPFYAEGRDALLGELGKRIGHTLRPGLCDSTSLASRVLWPGRLEGHPVYDILPEERAGAIFGKLRQWALPRAHMCFTDEVKKEFESR